MLDSIFRLFNKSLRRGSLFVAVSAVSLVTHL